MKCIKKIGVFGGTFDPIHIGHLVVAEVIREEFKLDKVIFVTSAQPPHKDLKITAAEDRFNMVQLAIKNNQYFEASRIELERKGISYTVDTIRDLKEVYGENVEFFFLAGTDTIQKLPKWKYIKNLLSLCNFIGVPRPDGSEVITKVIKYFGDLGNNIYQTKMPELSISSTELRERISHGKTIRYLVADEVLNYIMENNLYERLKRTKNNE